MREGVQQRIGAHEAQIDAQQREEICVPDVREGVQAAGPLVSTHIRLPTIMYIRIISSFRDIFHRLVSVYNMSIHFRSINGRVGNLTNFEAHKMRFFPSLIRFFTTKITNFYVLVNFFFRP